MRVNEAELPWYRDGLSFSCTQCGACCTGAPGFVWVTPEEIARLATYRKQSLEQFSRQFVRQVGDRYSLMERPGGDCVFWEKSVGCTVYGARPEQCRTWPFWPENVETVADWEHVCEICPGSGQGRLYTLTEIQTSITKTPQ